MKYGSVEQIEFCVSFLEAMCRRMRLQGKKVPMTVLRKLHKCEQDLAAIKE